MVIFIRNVPDELPLFTVLCRVAYGTVHRALKTLYDHEDNLVVAPHDISVLKEAVYKFFNASEGV